MKRQSLACLGLLALAACSDSAGPESTHPFEARVTVNGHTRRIESDSARFDLYCDLTDSTCSILGLTFTAANMVPGYNGNFNLYFQANNPPTQGFQLQTGTYPFNDITPFDIFVELDPPPGNGFWTDDQSGTLTISKADSVHLAGSFRTNLVQGNPNITLPPLTLRVTFDLLLDETPGLRP
jgi:hypothetical protein